MAILANSATVVAAHSAEFGREFAYGFNLFWNGVGSNLLNILKLSNATVWVMITLFVIHWLAYMNYDDNKIGVKAFVYQQERERFEIMRDLLMENNKELRTMREELRLLRKMNARSVTDKPPANEVINLVE